MIDIETNSVIKTDKYGLFDKVLVNTIKNLEIIGNNTSKLEPGITVLLITMIGLFSVNLNDFPISPIADFTIDRSIEPSTLCGVPTVMKIKSQLSTIRDKSSDILKPRLNAVFIVDSKLGS